jgi:hypothetical protein
MIFVNLKLKNTQKQKQLQETNRNQHQHSATFSNEMLIIDQNKVIKKHYLTAEQLRNFPGCESFSDEESEHIIETLTVFAHMAYELFGIQQ